MKKAISLLAFFIFAGQLAGTPAFARDDDGPQGVTVIGQCEREVEPDRVVFEFFLEELADTVESSSSRANSRYNKFLKTLTDLKLKDAILSTSIYNVAPKREWENKKQVLKGYLTTIGLKVETSELDRSGEILQAVGQAQYERIQGPRPFVSRAKRVQEERECLKSAGEDARAKAAVAAKALGIKLGKAFDVKESGGSRSGSPMPMYSLMKADSVQSPEAANIQYGKETISLKIEVTFYAD